MKKLLFSDGSVGWRDRGTWLDVEGIEVIATESNSTGLDVLQPAGSVSLAEPESEPLLAVEGIAENGYDTPKDSLMEPPTDAALS